jgi:hypothetical protein
MTYIHKLGARMLSIENVLLTLLTLLTRARRPLSKTKKQKAQWRAACAHSIIMRL